MEADLLLACALTPAAGGDLLVDLTSRLVRSMAPPLWLEVLKVRRKLNLCPCETARGVAVSGLRGLANCPVGAYVGRLALRPSPSVQDLSPSV